MEDSIKRETLTVTEAAKALGVGLNTAYGLVAAGKLRAVRIGRKKLVPRHEISAFLERESLASVEAA